MVAVDGIEPISGNGLKNSPCYKNSPLVFQDFGKCCVFVNNFGRKQGGFLFQIGENRGVLIRNKVGSIENPEYLDPTFSAVQNHFREVVHKTIGAEGDT